jgi:non-canonical (house-cleaning) NTP pyrophosphatase
VRVSLVEEKALDSILGDVKVTEVDAPAEEEKKPAAKKAAKKTAKKTAKKAAKKAAKKPAKKTEE